MFQGRKIPEMLTVSGLLDRTLWVFRHQFFDYMKICFVTYVPVMLLMILLWNLNIINLDFLEGSAWSPDLFFFVLFVTLPTMISDVALQIYTTHLVREEELHWFQAVKMAFSKDLARYSVVRMAGALVLICIGFLAVFVNLIPFIGTLVYWGIVIGVYTFTFGMAAPVILEDKKKILQVVGRNYKLGRIQFFESLLSSVSATQIAFCLLICIFIFFLMISGLVIALMQGQQTVMVMDNFSERYIFTLMIILVPLLFALFLTPMKSIYFSVLYYNLRSRGEGFHLENRVDIYLKEIENAEKLARESTEQELDTLYQEETISATA